MRRQTRAGARFSPQAASCSHYRPPRPWLQLVWERVASSAPAPHGGLRSLVDEVKRGTSEERQLKELGLGVRDATIHRRGPQEARRAERTQRQAKTIYNLCLQLDKLKLGRSAPVAAAAEAPETEDLKPSRAASRIGWRMPALVAHIMQTRPGLIREFERERGSVAAQLQTPAAPVGVAGDEGLDVDDMDEWDHELHAELELQGRG